uniref:Uroplakin-1b n=1 Tax=Ornithorhynchus anatinus TaxID=9258 RepID=A0A6I8N4P5_ORNAN
MAKDDGSVRCLQGLLVFGNVVIAMSGLALMAECIFFVTDPWRLYGLLEATDNDDVFAAAWIGIFTGFSLFCLAALGVVAVLRAGRKLLLAYLILMFVVYAFEMASCITAATQQDFFTPNLFLRQMLERYQNQSGPTNDDQYKNKKVTDTWDRLMLQEKCCGVNGPSDWQDYHSAFRRTHLDADFPWPHQCCARDGQYRPLSLDGCKLGVADYYHEEGTEAQRTTTTTGCYQLISGPLNRQAWGVAWFGFAILCWTFCVLLGVMFYWSRIEP